MTRRTGNNYSGARWAHSSRSGKTTPRELDITAANLRVGDIVLGGGSEVTVATLERIPANDIYPRGGVRYIGRISAGHDLGYCGSWSVQADQPERVRRG